MKTLVWGDVHNRTKLLKSFLDKNGDAFEKRIFLGDWFDQFNDRPDDAARTARYLIELIDDPRNVFIEGNHDTAYRFGTPISLCSGFTFEKKRFIDSVMKFHHWEKFKLFEVEQGWVCSHAGMHESIFEHPVIGMDLPYIQKMCDEAVNQARANGWHPVYDLGKRYDGLLQRGGLTWLRWWEFEPIPYFNQIVGHTRLNQPEVSYARLKVSRYKGKKTETLEKVKVDIEHLRNHPPKPENVCSWNYNIDTDNKYFIVIENGEVTTHLTLDYL